MNEDAPTHLGESDVWGKVEFYWDVLPLNESIEFEIVNFWKMRNKRCSQKKGWYCEFVACFVSPILSLKVIKGDLAIINIPYKSFERAIRPLNLQQKKIMKRIIGNDNLYMKIKKINHQGLDVIDLERREEDIKLTEQAGELLYDSE